MNRDLFLAILSMDSYNRSYGRGIKLSPGESSADRTDFGVQIGNATVLNIELPAGSKEAGFYGITYLIEAGSIEGITVDTKVVMYRGSDKVPEKIQIFLDYISGLLGGATDSDVQNGYGVALGSPYGLQARLAMEFFNAATGRDPSDRIAADGAVIVSGHSLGGGLAGLVGTLTGTRIALFDPMPFDLAAETAYHNALDGGVQTTLADGSSAVLPFSEDQLSFIEATYGGLPSGGYSPWLPTRASGVSGAYIPRAEGTINTNYLDWWRSNTSQSAITGVTAFDLPTDTPLGDTERNQVGQRHANTLLVIRMFGDSLGQSNQQWQSIARYWLPLLFDEPLGERVGGAAYDAELGGLKDRSGAMQNAIAYSSLEKYSEGATLIFGDTGIRALFDDANDFAKFLQVYQGDVPVKFGDDLRSKLSQIIVEFAGFYAIQKVESRNDANATEGALTLLTAEGEQAFIIDLRKDTWTADGKFHDLAVKFELFDRFIIDADALANFSSIAQWFKDSAENNGTGDILKEIDEVVFSLVQGKIASPRDAAGLALQIGANSDDVQTFGSGNDFVLGADGDDVLNGAGGSDILLGGSGMDTLLGGGNKDRLQGGAADDNLYGESGDDYLVAELDAANDLLYGGSGTDTIVYSVDESVTVTLTAPIVSAVEGRRQKNADFGISFSGLSQGGGDQELFGLDYLDSIERAAVETGDADDTLVVSSNGTGISLQEIAYVNLGEGSNALDLQSWTKSTTVDLSKDSLSWVEGNDAQHVARSLKVINANIVQGGSGNDQFIGGNQDNESYRLDGNGGKDVLKGGTSKTSQFALNGGDGNDTIIGGAGINTLKGDAGNDTLVSDGKRTDMYGGSGNDTFHVGGKTTSFDPEPGDIIYSSGIQLYGGVKQWWMEGGTAFWSPFSSVMNAFPVIGAEILITAAVFTDVSTMKFVAYQRDQYGNLLIHHAWGLGGKTVIKNYSVDLDSGGGTAGISVFQQELTSNFSFQSLNKFLNLALYASFGNGLPGFDPLLLDLDGDGYELTTVGNSRAYFEFDTDGFGERTGWVRGKDALLARDANGNAKIDGVTELFGNRTTSGFTMLAGFDGNGDGVINASDVVYAELRVWQDANQDGVSDPGELKSLAEAGIVSINLASTAPGTATAVGGNQIVRTSSFTRTDGSSSGIADVAFDIRETATKWLGDSTISASAALRSEAANDNALIFVLRVA